MDKLLLKLLLWLIRIFMKRQVDFDKLKIITETKIMMDRRRSPATWKRKQQKESKNPLLFTLIMYAFLGLLIGSLVFYLPIVLAMVVLHAYLLFMMAMTIITDFSSVLLDTADNQIILPKPISSRTLFLSRVVHILVYLLQFMIAIIGFPLVFTFIKYGMLSGTGMILTVLLTVAFAVFLTYLLYALILRFANEQKLKDIIGYFQVFMTVFFAAGYQLFPRFIDLNNINFTFHIHWYSYLLPPVWMAMSIESVHDLNFDAVHTGMIACAFIIPVLTVWLMMKFLAPSFSRKLAALNNNPDTIKHITTKASSKKKISEKLSGLLCQSRAESAGFEKVWKITSREKNFKVQFYPGMAYLVVFAFILIFKNGKNIVQTWQHLPSTKMFLFFVYLPLLGISSSLFIVPFNDNYAAAWIYQLVPLEKPGEIISGTVKALLVKFFIPVFIILFSFALYIWGPSVIDDFALGFFNNILIFLIMANLTNHYLPFSMQANVKQQTGKFLLVIIRLFFIAGLVGLHYLALKISWLPLTLIPFSVIGSYFLLKRIQDLPWNKIAV